MRDYLRSLDERIKESARQRDRYWTDPQFRLDRVNRARARLGRPLARSLEDVGKRGQRIGQCSA